MDSNIIVTLRADEFLNVRFGATEQEIKSAYLALMKRYHPDKNPRYVDRAGWICKMIGEARQYALAKDLERRYPTLEHYKPVLDGGPELCTCGFVKTDLICHSCGNIFLPKDETEENKDKVWNLCKQFALQLKRQLGERFDDWEAAGRLYRRHFNG